VFYTASLSLAFALTSVGLHDAISSFIVGHGEGAGGIGIAAGISLTTEWAFVPFSVTLAWQCLRPHWLWYRRVWLPLHPLTLRGCCSVGRQKRSSIRLFPAR
jgi:hypothetical protein